MIFKGILTHSFNEKHLNMNISKDSFNPSKNQIASKRHSMYDKVVHMSKVLQRECKASSMYTDLQFNYYRQILLSKNQSLYI